MSDTSVFGMAPGQTGTAQPQSPASDKAATVKKALDLLMQNPQARAAMAQMHGIALPGMGQPQTDQAAPAPNATAAPTAAPSASAVPPPPRQAVAALGIKPAGLLDKQAGAPPIQTFPVPGTGAQGQPAIAPGAYGQAPQGYKPTPTDLPIGQGQNPPSLLSNANAPLAPAPNNGGLTPTSAAASLGDMNKGQTYPTGNAKDVNDVQSRDWPRPVPANQTTGEGAALQQAVKQADEKKGLSNREGGTIPKAKMEDALNFLKGVDPSDPNAGNIIANVLDAIGVGLSAYGGVNRKTRLQQQFEMKVASQQAANSAKAQTWAALQTIPAEALAQAQRDIEVGNNQAAQDRLSAYVKNPLILKQIMAQFDVNRMKSTMSMPGLSNPYVAGVGSSGTPSPGVGL